MLNENGQNEGISSDPRIVKWAMFHQVELVTCGFMYYEMPQSSKLMRLGVANRIDVFESNLESEIDRRIVVDSDSNDLIESTISIFD